MANVLSKRLALLLVAAALLVGGGWIWLRDASALNLCGGVKFHTGTLNDGPPVYMATQGAITMSQGRTSITPDGRQVTELKVDDTFTHGNVEGLGELVITLDSSQEAPPSSLTANQADAPFPATQVVQFFPVFIINGEVFRTAEPARVVNSSVESFPPPPGTTYVLTNAMTLKSDEGNTLTLDPGKAFTIDG